MCEYMKSGGICMELSIPKPKSKGRRDYICEIHWYIEEGQ